MKLLLFEAAYKIKINTALLCCCGLILLLTFGGCAVNKNPVFTITNYVHLDSLYQQHQYFKLRNDFAASKARLSSMNKLVLKAKMSAVFNKRERSNQTIDSLFSQYHEELPDSTYLELLETKSQNSVFLFNYLEALQATQKLLAYDTLLTQEQRGEYENNQLIYDALKDAPKQSIQLHESTLPIIKDAAGLSRIPVGIHSAKQQAVFDTGANFSVITDSLAATYGLDTLGNTFKVQAITGNEVNAHIAVVDSLKLGDTLLYNVVFLVMPDESLSFPQINYSISMIIGFPVMDALKEIQIVENNKLHIVGRSQPSNVQNLALDQLTPVIEIIQNNSSLPFTFDTGSSATHLYKAYYDGNRRAIDRMGVQDSVGIGGAGGSKIVSVYKIPFSGAIAGQPFDVDSVIVFTSEAIKKSKGISGNLGQDVFSQFDTLSINFEQMYLQVQ